MRLVGHRFRRTTLLLWLCLSILIGIAMSWFGFTLQPVLTYVLVGVLLTIGLRTTTLSLLGVIIIGLTLGSARGGTIKQQLTGYDNLLSQKVLLQVSANEDAVYGKHTQLTFVAVNVVDLSTGRHVPGKIGVSGFGSNAILQDDTVIVEGKLRPGIGAYQGFMSYAKLEITQHHPSPVATLRRKFAAGMLSALPEPLASFSMGLLIGQRATLPDEVKQNLLMVGLTHIIAVSGYNLTIMLEASRKILGKRSKRISTGLSLGLMVVFVLMTGGSASIIRAAIVSSLSIAAAYYGHRPRPLLIIAMVAAITAYMNPIYIWSDASWYLSFLAFFGVLMVAPVLQNRLPTAFHKSVILAVALESICAEIMSVPYILYTFGQMSFIGLPANVLVVTLVPLAMLLGLIAGLAGMFLWPICGWLAWPAKILLMYMLDTAHVLANLPGIFIDGLWLTLPGLILLYCLIAFMTALLSFKDKLKSAIITDKELL